MEGRDIFRTIRNISKSNFASRDEFDEIFMDRFNGLKPSKADVASRINEIMEKLKPEQGKINQIEALKILLIRDLKEMKKTLGRIDFDDPKKEIEKFYPIFKNELKRLGFDFELPPIYFVDKFPHPYEDFDFTAMPFDQEDHERHGVNLGIHFRNSKIFPFVSVATLAHELIHVCAGLHDYHHFPRNLEEGTAEFFGAYYLASLVLPKDLVINSYVKNRLNYKINEPQRWEVYTEGSMIAAALYKKVGTSGIIEMLKRGRGEIKKVEEQILALQSDKVDLPKGGWVKDLDNFADFLLSYPRSSLVGSPLTRLIAEDIEVDKKVDEVIDDKYNQKQAEKAFKELAYEVGPILLTDGFFYADESKKYIRTNTFRYKIPENLAKEIRREINSR